MSDEIQPLGVIWSRSQCECDQNIDECQTCPGGHKPGKFLSYIVISQPLITGKRERYDEGGTGRENEGGSLQQKRPQRQANRYKYQCDHTSP